METLAYMHLSMAHEEANLNPGVYELKLFNGFNWKPPSSAWIRLLSAIMALSILSLANSSFAHKPHGGKKVDRSLGSQIQRYNNIHRSEQTKEVRVSTTKSSVSMGVSVQDQAPIQYGKLKLRNETDRGTTVFLFEPGAVKYTRYAYLPACSERTLASLYNNRWRVSMAGSEPKPLGGIKGGVFVVQTQIDSGTEPTKECDPRRKEKAKQIAARLMKVLGEGNFDPQSSLAVPVLYRRSPFSFDDVKDEATIEADKAMAKVSLQGSTLKEARFYMKELQNEKEIPAQIKEEVTRVMIAGVEAKITYYDKQMLSKTAEVLNVNAERENVKTSELLEEVATVLKGDGTNIDQAAEYLSQYIYDCYKYFFDTKQARSYLKFIQEVQWAIGNEQNKRGELLERLPSRPGREREPSYTFTNVKSLNAKIEPRSNEESSDIGPLGKILCVKGRRENRRGANTEETITSKTDIRGSRSNSPMRSILSPSDMAQSVGGQSY